MKKVKQTSLHIVNYLISLLLPLLGMSCSGQNTVQSEAGRVPRTIAMYGVPYSTYKISGKVENEKGKPVKGIEVSVMKSENSSQSNEKGTFNIEGRMHFRPDSIYMVVNDVDGTENEAYENDTIVLTPTYKIDRNDNSWSIGRAEIEDLKITIKKKK